MNVKIQIILFIIWLLISPWLGAYLYENVLPHGESYGLAFFVNVIVWVFTSAMGCAHFISIVEASLHE